MGAYEIPGFSVGVEPAAEDLTEAQFRAVVWTAYGWERAGANERDIGVLQNDPDTDEIANVLDSGISKVVAGAAFDADAFLTTDSEGRFVTAASGEHIVARALQAAGAAGDIVSAKLGYHGTAD
jgi:hypothetical protein